jgi:hypothetical protein
MKGGLLRPVADEDLAGDIGNAGIPHPMGDDDNDE